MILRDTFPAAFLRLMYETSELAIRLVEYSKHPMAPAIEEILSNTPCVVDSCRAGGRLFPVNDWEKFLSA
jgi:hypothetical protein